MNDDDGADTSTTPPPGVGPAVPVRRLGRRTDDKIIAGVASGLAEYTGLDKVIFRITFVVLLLAGGTGAILYLLAWWLIPEKGRATSAGERALARFKNWPWWTGAALLVIGTAAIVDGTDFAPGLVWGIALIVVGFLVFRHDPDARPPRDPGAPRASAEWLPATAPGETSATTEIGASGPATADAPVAKASRVREHSPLGWITLAIALIAAAIATLVSNGLGEGIRPAWLLALVLAILGAGLVVGSFAGRARWLILLGLPLIPLLLAASLIHVPFKGGFGERSFQPRLAIATEKPYRLIGGVMHVDLTRLPYESDATTITASVVAGSLDIVVPRDVTVTVDASMGAGRLSLFGREDDGIQVDETRIFDAGAGAPRLDLQLDASFGEIRVSHAGPEPRPESRASNNRSNARNKGAAKP